MNPASGSSLLGSVFWEIARLCTCLGLKSVDPEKAAINATVLQDRCKASLANACEAVVTKPECLLKGKREAVFVREKV